MHDLKGQGLTKDDTSSRVRLSPTTIKERTLRSLPVRPVHRGRR